MLTSHPVTIVQVGQGPIALAVGAGGGCLDIFTLVYPFSSLSPSLWETARYRLKYCLKGPLHPKQPTNQPSFKEIESLLFFSSNYSPTNFVRVKALNRKGRNIYLKTNSSFLWSGYRQLYINSRPMYLLLNVLSALEGTSKD